MKKQILLTMLLALTIVLSVGAISASEVNVTDSYTTSLVDDMSDVSVPMENAADSSVLSVSSDSNVDNDSSKVSLSSEEVLESGNSNNLSTNSDINYLSSDESEGIAHPAAYSDEIELEASSDSNQVLGKSNSYIGYGYWLFGGDMKSVNLNTLASQGTTDIFLNFYAITAHGKSAVESWISSANKLGIRVHIWMQSFYDGSWINPIKNGTIDTAYFNQKINEAKSYAAIKGISGVHLDYLRYPGNAYKTTGGTEAISEFTRQVSVALHNYNSNLIVSCALMPETTNNIYYYGQDLSAISKYVDVVIPMMYKGNYGKTSAWIDSTSRWFISNSKGAQVWAGLQGYKSDDDTTKLSTTEITNDAKSAIGANAAGVAIFRWGLTNFVNFNTINDSTPAAGSISVANVIAGATNLKEYFATNKKLPDTITVGETKFTLSEFLYLMSKAIQQIGSSDNSDITLILGVNDPASPAGNTINANLYKADYLTVAGSLVNVISTKKTAPNYVSSSLGKISYHVLTEAFSRVLAYYGANNQLPNYVSINSQSVPAIEKASITNIITAANNLKRYYAANNKLPDSVGVGGIRFTMPEFLYLMSKAIQQLGNSDKSSIAYITGVTNPASSSGDSINAKLNKAGYLTVANNVANYIKSYNQAPNYASSSLGKISYTAIIDAFSRILPYYSSNNKLPDSVSIKSDSTPVIQKVSVANVITAATNLKSYYAANNKLPDTVTAGGIKFTLPEFLYLMSKAIQQLGNSDKSDIAYITGVNDAASPSGDSIKDNLYKADYLAVAGSVVNVISTKKTAPNYVSSSLGKISYTVVTEAFSRVLAFYGTNNQLPNYVSINSESVPVTDKVSIANIITASNNLKRYYAANNKLPDSVGVGGIRFTMPEFLYLMSKAIQQLGNSDKSNIAYITGVNNAASSSGDSINAKLNKAGYLTVANNVANYIKSYNQAPNYASSSVGKISYTMLMDVFSRILPYYGSNNKLPDSVSINTDSAPITGTISIAKIVTGAANLKTYYSTNKMLPSTVTAGGIKFTMPEFLYLMSKAIQQLGNSDKSDIAYIAGVDGASSSYGDSISEKLNKSDYLTVANNVANYIKSYNQAPNYASSVLGKISYTALSDAFARVLAYYGENNKLSNYVTIRSPGATPAPDHDTGSGLNEKNTITNLAPYLLETKNCQVNDTAIKTVVDSLIEGLTTDYQKAQAIYNYVRDAISYSFYYNTRYGATGTLSYKTGNCVDQSHLLVAMYRTAGLAARYVHGTCRFSSATYGHVWTQVLIDDYWIVGDPTSNRNSFGSVVNWNTNSFTLHGIFREISF